MHWTFREESASCTQTDAVHKKDRILGQNRREDTPNQDEGSLLRPTNRSALEDIFLGEVMQCVQFSREESGNMYSPTFFDSRQKSLQDRNSDPPRLLSYGVGCFYISTIADLPKERLWEHFY